VGACTADHMAAGITHVRLAPSTVGASSVGRERVSRLNMELAPGRCPGAPASRVVSMRAARSGRWAVGCATPVRAAGSRLRV
jgi:hypothetical protein